NPPPFAAHHIDHHDFNAFQETDGEYAVFPVTALSSLERRPVENPYGILEIDVVLCEVRLPFTLVPLEKHLYPSTRRASSQICTMRTYITTHDLGEILGDVCQPLRPIASRS